MSTPAPKRVKVRKEMPTPNENSIVILKSGHSENVGSVQYTDLCSVTPFRADDNRWTFLNLNDNNDELGNITIFSYSYPLGTSAVVFLLHFVRTRDVKTALKISLDETDSDVDRHFLIIFRDINKHPFIFSVALNDCMTDYLITRLRELKREEAPHRPEELLEPLKLYWGAWDFLESRVFGLVACYHLHHVHGLIESDSDKRAALHRALQKQTLKWLLEMWQAKDWSVGPKDILAEDFDEYCRYHGHGDKPCYRLEQQQRRIGG